jgi:hypothetical protein
MKACGWPGCRRAKLSANVRRKPFPLEWDGPAVLLPLSEELSLSKCLPGYIRRRTSLDTVAMSQRCQEAALDASRRNRPGKGPTCGKNDNDQCEAARRAATARKRSIARSSLPENGINEGAVEKAILVPLRAEYGLTPIPVSASRVKALRS